MENTKRRRGISLAHQSSACQTLQDSAPVQQPTTRLQYNRYPISQSPSRHASAPKPKVTFAYVLGAENIPYSPYPAYSRNPSAFTLPEQPHPHLSSRQPGRIEVRRVPTPELRQFELTSSASIVEMAQPSALSAYRLPSNPVIQTAPAHQVTSVSPLSTPPPLVEQTPTINEGATANAQIEQPLLERYFSFEHCKESIAKRIFTGSGVSGGSSREETQSRSNRWIEPAVEAALPVVENKTRKQHLEIQRSVFSFVPDPKLKALQPQTVLKEAVTQTIVEISKENVAPSLPLHETKENKEVKTQKKVRRDPMKLKEMEQRLLQIIKICDENM